MSLNPQQLEAIRHEQGPLLILAGAGTGKTRVITHRIAHLIERGVPPARILAVTFTNKAAGEMKLRVEKLVGNKAQELWVGTFHSICLRLLRRFALEAGIAPSFVVYDAADQLGCIKEVVRSLNLDEKRFPPTSFVHRISRLKDQLLTPASLFKSAQNPFEKVAAEVYTAYQALLAKNHALDFGDLISQTVFLLQGNEKVLAHCQNFWQHVFIDEYQDTNHAQYTLISLIAARHKNICVVGDPDQSIYRWRGADLNNILEFEKEYPDAKVIRLEQNYRSVETILRGAAAVITNNRLRKEKSLWSGKEGGEKIIASALNSEKEEAQFVIKQSLQWQEQGIPFREMAVFYRTNAQSRALEEGLRIAGIPYRIYGGISFYERAEIKDLLAYLRLLQNPADGIGFKRVVNMPPRGIGKTTVERIENLAQERRCSMLEAAGLVEGHAKLRGFVEWVAARQAGMDGKTLVEFLEEIMETSGLIDYLSKLGPIEGKERLENVNELLAAVAEFEEDAGEALSCREKLLGFLERVALISDLDKNETEGALSLMTLHLAKGLEFQCVAITGVEEGLLPHSRSQEELEELEEERRLFFVGMTRAKERLVLTHAWRRYLYGREQYSLPSRFIEEIPAELIESRGQTEQRTAGGSDRYEYDSFDQTGDQTGEPEENPFPIGSRVKHPSFGTGVVRKCEPTSLGAKLTVQFNDGQIKKLIADYVTRL